MEAERPDPAAGADGSGSTWPWPISVYVLGFVAVFVLATGVGLVGLLRAAELTGGLLAVTLAGLLVFLAAALVFHRRIARPISELSAGVRAAMTCRPAGPITVTGPAEISSLVRDINMMIARAGTDFETAASLAAIVESSSDAIIGKTLDGIITNWNTAAEQQYGYTREEIIGRSIAVLVEPGRRAELAPMLERVRRGERIERLETRRVRKDGTTIDVSISISPIRDESGVVTGAATVARNITERILIEADRRQLDRHVQQVERVESLGQLAGGIAHDFNNLLGVIINYAGFVAQQTAGNPAVLADVEQIQKAAQRAGRITRQLLIVGRRDAMRAEALGLNAVITDTRDLLSATVGAGIDIRLALATDPVTIEADHGQVEQVLLNLVLNARDAMPRGGTLTMTTSLANLDEGSGLLLHPAAAPGRYVELAVSDTGTGISAEVAAHIFEPFFTTKPIGEGTGLGLATVYSVVTGAGGSIGVDSQHGAGTTFRLYFPAAGPQAAAAAPTVEVPRTRGSGQAILVADDEPAVLEIT